MDGSWHSVTLLLNTSTLTMITDGALSTLSNTYLTNTLGTSIYIGHTHSSGFFATLLAGVETSFEGCFRNLQINSVKKDFNLARRTTFLLPLPTAGCSQDKCFSSQLECRHYGTCKTGSSGVTCNCRPGYTGTRCETSKQTVTVYKTISITLMSHEDWFVLS